MSTIKALCLALLLALSASSTTAEVPDKPKDWVAITGMIPCTVDVFPDIKGMCRLFEDDAGNDWLVFWDAPRQVRIIRSKIDGEYVYFYERAEKELGSLL